MIGIGIDIGGTFVKFFVLNQANEILRQARLETDASRGAAYFVSQLADFIQSVRQEYPQQKIAVAVGAPGDVDHERGLLRYNPNLKFTDVDNWPLADQLHAATGLRPLVANDANLAAWGVYTLDLKHQGRNVLVATLGTGVGCGLILNGELYQGSHGTAGELGHTKIADPATGPVCGCGAHSCLEAFVGTIGIKYRTQQALAMHPQSLLAKLVRQEPDFKIELLSRAAEQGCPVALTLWKETGRYLGIGLANAVLLLDVDTVVLTGGISAAAPYFMPALQAVFAQQQIKTPFEQVKLLVSQNPNIGGIGAALFALHHAAKNA